VSAPGLHRRGTIGACCKPAPPDAGSYGGGHRIGAERVNLCKQVGGDIIRVFSYEGGKADSRYGAELVATIAEALHYAHTRGLVHRDLKPANILLDASGRPCLADFGLALKDEDFGKVAAIAGSPPYMSPDQASGEGHRVDGRSDIFSLGIVFYELLTGRPRGAALGAPRPGNSPGTVLTASLFHPPMEERIKDELENMGLIHPSCLIRLQRFKHDLRTGGRPRPLILTRSAGKDSGDGRLARDSD